MQKLLDPWPAGYKQADNIMRTNFDIKTFCGVDKLRPVFSYICYRNGHMLASDGHMAAYVAADYAPEYEGKNINPYSGEEGNGKSFPNLEGIIEGARKDNTIRVKLDIERLKAACKLCAKGVLEWVSVSFPAANGEIVRVGMRKNALMTIVHALEAFGIDEALIYADDPTRRVVMFDCPAASFVLMPVRFDDNYIDMDGTISAGKAVRDKIRMGIGAAEAAAAKVPENESELRKVKAAQKRAETYRELLAMIEAGKWTGEEEKAGEETKTEEQPEADGRQAVSSDGRRLYDFIAQGRRAPDGKLIYSGYFAEDAMVLFAMGLVAGLRDRCKNAEIRVFTPNGKGGNTLVRVQD